jgi:hypothetical protein
MEYIFTLEIFNLQLNGFVFNTIFFLKVLSSTIVLATYETGPAPMF